MSDVIGTLIAQRDEALEHLSRLTFRLEGMEQSYHMYPSFDRPVEGCNNCAAVANAKKVLSAYARYQDTQSGQRGE